MENVKYLGAVKMVMCLRPSQDMGEYLRMTFLKYAGGMNAYDVLLSLLSSSRESVVAGNRFVARHASVILLRQVPKRPFTFLTLCHDATVSSIVCRFLVPMKMFFFTK